MRTFVARDSAEQELAQAEMEERRAGSTSSDAHDDLEPNVQTAVDTTPHPDMEIEKSKDGSSDLELGPKDLQPLADRQRRHDGDSHPRLSDEMKAEGKEDVDTPQEQEDPRDCRLAEDTQQPRNVDELDVEQCREESQGLRSVDDTHPEEARGLGFQKQRENPQDPRPADDVYPGGLKDLDSEHQHENPEDHQVADDTHTRKMNDWDADEPHPQKSEDVDMQLLGCSPDPWQDGKIQERETGGSNTQRQCIDPQGSDEMHAVGMKDTQHPQQSEGTQLLEIDSLDTPEEVEDVQDTDETHTGSEDMKQQHQRDSALESLQADNEEMHTSKMRNFEGLQQFEDQEDTWRADRTYLRAVEGSDPQQQGENPHERRPGDNKKLRRLENSDMQQEDVEIQDFFPSDDRNKRTTEILDVPQQREVDTGEAWPPDEMAARGMEIVDANQQPEDPVNRWPGDDDTDPRKVKSTDIQQPNVDRPITWSLDDIGPQKDSSDMPHRLEYPQDSQPRENTYPPRTDRAITQEERVLVRDEYGSHGTHPIAGCSRMEGPEHLDRPQEMPSEELESPHQSRQTDLGLLDRMQHQYQNHETVWSPCHSQEEQNSEQREQKTWRSMPEQNLSVQVALKTPKQEFHRSKHPHDSEMVCTSLLMASSQIEKLVKTTVRENKDLQGPEDPHKSLEHVQAHQRTDMELSLAEDGSRSKCPLLPDSLRTQEKKVHVNNTSCKVPDVKLEKHGDLFIQDIADTRTGAKRSTLPSDGFENLGGVGQTSENQPVSLNSAVLNFIGRMRGSENHTAARVQIDRKMSWPTTEITRQLLETSIIGQQCGASTSAPAISGSANTMEQASEFGKIDVRCNSAIEPKADVWRRFEAASAALEMTDLGGSEEVAAALQALQSLQNNEDDASDIPDSNISSALTGKSSVCSDVGDAVTTVTLLPVNSKEETFRAPSAGLAGAVYATESHSSESKNLEHLQYATTMSRTEEEASRARSLEKQIAATSRIRAEIMSHSVFPEMLAAHGACLRVTIPDNHMLGVSDQLLRSQELLRAYSAFAPVHDEHLDPAHKQQLDNFMRSHTDALWDLHAQLEDSVSLQVKDAMAFIAKVENESRNLFSASRAQDFDSNIDPEINRAVHNQVTMESVSDEFGPIVPMGSEHSIMKAIRAQLKLQYGQEGFWKKITDVRDEIVRKRRAGKLPTGTTAMLKEWWNQHVEWPYPAEEDKERFMEETGLELKQINNWFINQRKRNWNNGSSSKSSERRNKHRA